MFFSSPRTAQLLNNLLYCSVSIGCVFAPTSRSSLPLSFLECPLFHLFKSCPFFQVSYSVVSPSLPPTVIFLSGLGLFFSKQVWTHSFCVHVCVPHATESECWDCYFCVPLTVSGTGVGTQTVFSLWMGGWMDEKEWYSFGKVFWEF